MGRLSVWITGVFLAVTAGAQMPHEVLLLVNRQSQASVKVANTYAESRQIPLCNIVYLDIPEEAYGGTATITPEQFTKLIWKPANEAAKAQGIDKQILAWVYSVDFPIRVKTDSSDRKQMSVGGMTFVRNRIPGLSLVEEGKYFSRLFMGSNERLKLNLPSQSLRTARDGLGEDATVEEGVEYLKTGLGDEMPLPSMMLGYIGEKGTDVETVLKTIQRGVRSDYRGMRSGIYFLMSDDVRSTCREWQLYPALNELSQRSITATITTNFPAGEKDVMGILMGAETVDPSQIDSFAPGAMAEHLTSWSAEFQRPQTKLTAWLEAGATGTAGAVVEPYANFNKFPSARFFVHYTSGCTMLESFYQSIACPLQNLLLGDPLARPYSLHFSAKILGADTIKNDFTYFVQTKSRVENAEFLYSFLLDGKEVRGISGDPSIFIRSLQLSSGYHELRACVRLKHPSEPSISVDKGFMVDRMGRSVSIDPDIRQIDASSHAIRVKVGGAELPEKVKLMRGIQILDEKPYSEEASLVLDEKQIGEGPNRIRVVGVYMDGMEVSSAPATFTIRFRQAE